MTALSIVEVFGASAAAFGGIEGIKWIIRRFFPAKTEKRQDEAEVKQTEVDAEKALRDMYEDTIKELREEFATRIKDVREEYTERIKELREANSHLNNQVIEMLKAGARKDEIIADKVNKIRELQEQLAIEAEKRLQDAKENGRLSKLVLFYRAWHCEREYGCGKDDCRRRKPEQNPPLKYSPIEAEVATNGIFIRETAPDLIPQASDDDSGTNPTE